MVRHRHHRGSFRLSSLVAGLIGLGLVAGVIFRFGGFFSPSNFGAFDRFNVVVTTPKETQLMSLSPSLHTISVIRLPSDLYVPFLTHGYGSYRLGKVYQVGQLDKRGGEVLMTTVRELVGAPIEGYVVSDTNLDLTSKQVFLTPAFFLQDQSSLAFLDRLRFAWAFSQIRTDRLKDYDVGSVTQKLILPDGSEAQTIEQDSLDAFLGSAFVEDHIQDEHLRIEVGNSTSLAGLGSRASRILSAIGGSVIMVNSQNELQDKCVVWFNPAAKSSRTLQRVAQIFSCEQKPQTDSSRAEISVVLGANYVRELTK